MKINRRKFLGLFGIAVATPVVAKAISMAPIKPSSGGDFVIKGANTACTGVGGAVTITGGVGDGLTITNILPPSKNPITKEYVDRGFAYFDTKEECVKVYDGNNWIRMVGHDPTQSA